MDWVIVGLVVLFVALMLILLLLLVLGAVSSMPNPCTAPRSMACLDHRMQECLARETYTRAECVALVGGGGR